MYYFVLSEFNGATKCSQVARLFPELVGNFRALNLLFGRIQVGAFRPIGSSCIELDS